MKDYTKTKEYKDIKKALMNNLKENSNYNAYFIGLVDDYMKLYVIKNQLADDIDARGVVCKYQNGKEQWGYKRNDSINDFNKVSGQMLRILSQLKIKANEIEIIEEDEEL